MSKLWAGCPNLGHASPVLWNPDPQDPGIFGHPDQDP